MKETKTKKIKAGANNRTDKKITPAEIKFFELAEREKALTWIKQ
tara:strand:+ start:7290 stop:7421 length:132 start_codon:yes stop_codon:yes gene_type:complete